MALPHDFANYNNSRGFQSGDQYFLFDILNPSGHYFFRFGCAVLNNGDRGGLSARLKIEGGDLLQFSGPHQDHDRGSGPGRQLQVS